MKRGSQYLSLALSLMRASREANCSLSLSFFLSFFHVGCGITRAPALFFFFFSLLYPSRKWGWGIAPSRMAVQARSRGRSRLLPVRWHSLSLSLLLLPRGLSLPVRTGLASEGFHFQPPCVLPRLSHCSHAPPKSTPSLLD